MRASHGAKPSILRRRIHQIVDAADHGGETARPHPRGLPSAAGTAVDLAADYRRTFRVGLQAVRVLVVQHRVGPKRPVEKRQHFRVADEVHKRIAPV